jgi:phosphodiesterase/alkaline phosphatase D-like protein
VDDNANGNSAALQTSHQITLRNLEPNQIYHYRITSCNGNRICTN